MQPVSISVASRRTDGLQCFVDVCHHNHLPLRKVLQLLRIASTRVLTATAIKQNVTPSKKDQKIARPADRPHQSADPTETQNNIVLAGIFAVGPVPAQSFNPSACFCASA